MTNLQLSYRYKYFSHRFAEENKETLAKTQGIIAKPFRIWGKNSRNYSEPLGLGEKTQGLEKNLRGAQKTSLY